MGNEPMDVSETTSASTISGPLRIPDCLEAVDSKWITSALRINRPSVVVSKIDVESVVHGAATKARLHLTFDGPASGISATVWVKAGWEEHSEWLGSSMRLYAREAYFYRDLNPL